MEATPRSPINSLLGIEAVDLEDGEVQLRLDTTDEHFNEVGFVHGGIAALLCDGAMGRAVTRTLSPGASCATVQFSIQYLDRAEGRLTARSRILRRGRNVAFLEAECTRDDGRVVARAQGTWTIREARS